MRLRIFSMIVFWAAVIPALASGVVMAIWNVLMPDLFGLAAINFWQALGLFALCQVLTGGFFIGLLAMAGVFHRMFHHNMHLHNAEMHKKWAGMSNEQRREFIMKRWNSRRGGMSGHIFGEEHDTFGEETDGKQTDTH